MARYPRDDQTGRVNGPQGAAQPGRGTSPPAGPGYRPELPAVLARLLGRCPHLRRLPHSLLAHFPIVFMLSTTFFSLLYVVTGHRSFDDTAFYCLVGGLCTMPLTIATGLFTHWLNFPGEADKTVQIEKKLSFAVMAIAAVAFAWHWLNPRVLDDLAGVNLIYFLLILSLTPLVTANGYFGGMLTFPLGSLPPLAGGKRAGEAG
jgi:uncharacterized membrane protein